MNVRDPKGVSVISVDESVAPVKYYVKDENDNILFESKGYESADIAIQWAIDYQSSAGAERN